MKPVLMRLTFSTRIGLIVFASVALVWFGAIALFLVSQTRETSGAAPLPTQIVAVVDLLEHMPIGGQQQVLDAASSDLVAMRLEPGTQLGAPSARPLLRFGRQRLERYLAVLGERPLTVTQTADTRRLLARFAPNYSLEFRIALRSAQTLVIDTRAPQIFTLFGLPAGFGAGLFGVAVTLLALFIMHRETRPLARLVAEVDRIDLSNSAAPLTDPSRSAPEIRALVDAFNRLQTRLSHLLKARMAMLGGISHDVRTFATRLRLRVDAIADADQRERAVTDIDDMIRLLDDALLASQAGAGEFAHELVEFDEIVRAEVNDRLASGAAIALQIVTPRLAAANARAHGATSTTTATSMTTSGRATLEPTPTMTVLGDRLALRRITANLLDNALKYGHRVEVALDVRGGIVELTIDDDGPGIPLAQRELMLEPFARLESSRNRGTGGAGLGLAIVRTLVEAQGGSTRILDATLGGARLVVQLPVFEA